jgi:thiol-disulfide isomerase/thioredoxin
MKRWGILGLLVLLCGFSVGTPMLNFEGAARWINSPGLDPAELQGKVVLVDFWEYTCLNCLRTLPYLREWYKRYHSDGFIIVGVHSPEFAFSSQADQVDAATKRLDVTWPVAVDGSLTIWKRYGVNEWPTELLYDQSGKLVEIQLGEGNYPYTESKIQGLLKAANPSLSLPPVMALLPQDSYNKPGAVCYPHTQEVLVGHQPVVDAPPPMFGDPSSDLAYHDRSSEHRDGAIYLDGFWHATREALAFGGGSGYFDMAYHAIEVEVVMTPSGGATRVDVTQDGKPLAKDDAGSDVHYDATGMSYVNVDASRAYHVVENKKYGTYDLKLSPKGFGLAVYDVDFESCEVPGAH